MTDQIELLREHGIVVTTHTNGLHLALRRAVSR